jgi:hypothetical protein
MVARGSINRKTNYEWKFGSYIGTSWSIFAGVLSLSYLAYLTTQMHNFVNDKIYSIKSLNPLVSENLYMKDYVFFPTIALYPYNGMTYDFEYFKS